MNLYRSFISLVFLYSLGLAALSLTALAIDYPLFEEPQSSESNDDRRGEDMLEEVYESEAEYDPWGTDNVRPFLESARQSAESLLKERKKEKALEVALPLIESAMQPSMARDIEVALEIEKIAALFEKHRAANEASVLYERAMEIHRNINSSHMHILQMRLIHLETQQEKNRRPLTEIIPLYEYALHQIQGWIEEGIEDEEDRSEYVLWLADLYEITGRKAEAIFMMEKALWMREEFYGLTAIPVAGVRAKLGELYRKAKKTKRAELLQRRQLISTTILIEGETRELSEALIANLLEEARLEARSSGKESNRKVRAAFLKMQALAIRASGFKTSHPDVQDSLKTIGQTLETQGELSAVISFYKEWIDILEDKGAYSWSETTLYADILYRYGDALIASNLWDLKQIQKAIASYERAIKIYQPSEYRFELAHAYKRLAVAYVALDDWVRANSAYAQASKLMDKTTLKEYHDYVQPLEIMAVVSKEKGYRLQAIRYYRWALKVAESKADELAVLRLEKKIDAISCGDELTRGE